MLRGRINALPFFGRLDIVSKQKSHLSLEDVVHLIFKGVGGGAPGAIAGISTSNSEKAASRSKLLSTWLSGWSGNQRHDERRAAQPAL